MPSVSAGVELLDQAGLEELATLLASDVQAGDVVLLEGPLGSGKSVFARAFLRRMGVQGSIPSPSFIVDAVYDVGSLEVHHIDLYRLSGDPEELSVYGIDEALYGDCVAIVEWADRLDATLPESVLFVKLEYADDPNLRRVAIRDGRLAGD